MMLADTITATHLQIKVTSEHNRTLIGQHATNIRYGATPASQTSAENKRSFLDMRQICDVSRLSEHDVILSEQQQIRGHGEMNELKAQQDQTKTRIIVLN
ncbi:hypothetical protein CBL_04163 [Carabus blaptoides fortunei]